MAKKLVPASKVKVVDKKVNLVSMLIAIVLFGVAAFGYTTTTAPDLDVFGIKFAITADEVTAMFSGYVFARDIVGLAFVFICLLFQLVALIRLVVMFFKLFGFFGKKDVNVMKKKLSTFAKSAFGVMALEISILVIASYDNGAFSQNATTLMILAGVLFFLLYALVRFYRWFVVEKRYWLDCLFEVLKDALFIACPIFLLSLIDARFLGAFGEKLFTMYGRLESEFITMNAISDVIGGATTIILMFMTHGLMRKTMKLMVFNNYKKSAYEVKGKYIALFVFSFLFAVSIASISLVNTGSFSSDALVPALLSSLLSSLPYLLAMVGVCVGSGVNEKETAKREMVEIEVPDEEVAGETEEVAEESAEEENAEIATAEK